MLHCSDHNSGRESLLASIDIGCIKKARCRKEVIRAIFKAVENAQNLSSEVL